MAVPWKNEKDLKEAVLFLSSLDKNFGETLEPVRVIAKKIQSLYEKMAPVMENISQAVCPDCQNSCCERATIWYDFKDLLYLYFGPGCFPDSQIEKSPGPWGPQCSQLSTTGCTLPRQERPFVCTWYFCPDQKALDQYPELAQNIIKLKALRLELEIVFCGISAPGDS